MSGRADNSARYSKETLLSDLKKLGLKLGHTPSVIEIKTSGIASGSTYKNRFGSLANALQLAGLDPNGIDNRAKHRKEGLISDMKKVAHKLGHTPSSAELAAAGINSGKTYYHYFGTLGKAQQQAGLKPNTQGRRKKYNKEGLLSDLKNIARQLGHTPSTAELLAGGLAPRVHYYYYFGTMSKANQLAGLKPNERGRPKRSKKELLSDLKKLAIKLDYTPSSADLGAVGIASTPTYIKYFGSLRKAQQLAGLEPNETGKPKRSKKELLSDMKKLAIKLDHTPSSADLGAAGIASTPTYIKYFGSLSKAQQLAGLEPNERGSGPKRNKEELLYDLKKLARKLGHTPSAAEIQVSGIACWLTYHYRFGSMRKAQQLAGLKPNERGFGHHLRISKKECMDELKRVVIKLKHMPTGDELALHAKLPIFTIKRLVGGIKVIAQIKVLRRLAYAA